ncbi:hypothetical protein LTR62_001423 [Meristemomyces frigidus]|uniref:Zn(2)-C6 fungal-type domain-containing protein n=1 Tax=Meristemomyces frigidus TaxID=1508187 RepID=A0AAN7TAZ5_9PEZI|nr:hypothetical protein LTR62_001423 [Meristemomyces frigidus]
MDTGYGSGIQHHEYASASPETPARPGAKESRESKSEREKRTYRACLHCRQRKSRCDLYSSGEPGRPPCERCIREQHECILGGSRRGGRRVKRAVSDATTTAGGADGRQVPSLDGVLRSLPIADTRVDYHSSSSSEPRVPTWSGIDRESRVLPPLQPDPPQRTETAHDRKMTVDETVASTDLQNPADALDFLANVAERNAGPSQLPPMQTSIYSSTPQHAAVGGGMYQPPPLRDRASLVNVIDFAPLTKGLLTMDTIRTLLNRYEEKYHPFFPLANPLAFDIQNLSTIAAQEPHLLTAILTVASKDDKDWWQWHETCSAHMMQLIAELVYGAEGTVEAVEAMLILAEWVPRRPHSQPAVGRGEEDQAAWMYTGTAIRLGYLLGIDRTGFRTEADEQSLDINRKRLAWAACYMSDRQISVRIGKAFWSRGPGPMTALRAQDFPSLRPTLNHQDDFAAIFQANLELTQLFSNAHDVLYATKSRSNQLNFGGEYVKYIDDFRTALRSWQSTWGVFTCSSPLKASLVLSYEYLRLYINAFAYQATLNRLVAQVQASSANGSTAKKPAYPFADVAATPDARFIYDAIDAAKSLLSTFNSFVDPVETFRFMPLRYYLYVIYSACFLYKARSTGVMGGDTRGSVKRMITDTVDKLQRASACTHDVGDRYSRLIRLLWRKPPAQTTMSEPKVDAQRPNLPHLQPTNSHDTATNNMQPVDPAQTGMYDATNNNNFPSINTFSWLDLPAVGDFATQNNGLTGSMDGFDRFDDSSADGLSNFDPNMMMAQQFAYNNLSPSGIVF